MNHQKLFVLVLALHSCAMIDVFLQMSCGQRLDEEVVLEVTLQVPAMEPHCVERRFLEAPLGDGREELVDEFVEGVGVRGVR